MATEVRVYEISTAAVTDLNNNEICSETVEDSDLGFYMWGGKDNAGNITRWLAKDEDAKVANFFVTGDAGIGTLTPGYVLDVQAVTTDGINLTDGTNNLVQLINDGGTSGLINIYNETDLKIHLDADSDSYITHQFGVGTETPDRQLDVFSTTTSPQVRITHSAGVYTDLQTTALGAFNIESSSETVGINNDAPNFGLDVLAGDGDGVNVTDGTNNLVQLINDGGTSGMVNVYDETDLMIHLDADSDSYFTNNLGIGTETPATNLDVYSATTVPQVRISYSGAAYTGLQTTSDGEFNIVPSGSFVGINNDNPGKTLDVYTTTQDDGIGIFDGSNYAVLMAKDDTDSGYIDIYDGGMGGIHLDADSDSYFTNNLGIGTTAPMVLEGSVPYTDHFGLHIKAAANKYASLVLETTSNLNSTILFYKDDSASGKKGWEINGTSSFTIANVGNDLSVVGYALYVDQSTNNVGIGNITNPGRALDVQSPEFGAPQLRLRYFSSTFTDFETDSSGHLYINPTGARVNINGKLSPDATLTVVGELDSIPQLRLTKNESLSTEIYCDFTVSTAGGLLIEPYNGLVGINAIDSGYTLNISDETGGILHIQATSNTYNSIALYVQATKIGDNSSYDILRCSNTTGNAITVRGDRKMGINTTSPVSILHVGSTASTNFCTDDVTFSRSDATTTDGQGVTGLVLMNANTTANNFSRLSFGSISSTGTHYAIGGISYKHTDHSNTTRTGSMIFHVQNNGSDISALTLQSTGATTFGSTYDVYSEAWTSYGDTSTIVGWSAFSTKYLYYKRIGKLMFVSFKLEGTSDSTAITFTLPYTREATSYVSAGYKVRNNGTTSGTPGEIVINGTLITLYTTFASGTWTASGTKEVQGQFWYEID